MSTVLKRLLGIFLLFFLAFCNKNMTPKSQNVTPSNSEYEKFLDSKKEVNRRSLDLKVAHGCSPDPNDGYTYENTTSDTVWNKAQEIPNPSGSKCMYGIKGKTTDVESASVSFFAQNSGKKVHSQEGIGYMDGSKIVTPQKLLPDTKYLSILAFKKKGESQESYVKMPPFIIKALP